MENFGSLLRQAAVNHTQKTAIIVGEGRITYEELDQSTDRLACVLQQHCEPGDRIAVHWPNSIETVKLIFACGKAGLICVPINVQLRKAEIAYILENSGAVLCFAPPELATLTREAGRNCPALHEVISTLSFSDVQKNAALPAVSGEEAVLILYTSGTTAQPKGVTHSHRSLLAGACMFYRALSSDLEVTLVITQLAFISSFVTGLLPALMAGGTVVLSRHFEAATVLSLIEQFHCRYTFGLPVMAQALAEEQEHNPRQIHSLRTFVAGGDSVPRSTQNKFRQLFGFSIREAYGMTEIGPALLNPVSVLCLGSLGLPLDGVSATVLDAFGNAVPDNEVGELSIKSAATFLHYWDNPEATAQVYRNEWMLTGDFVRRDSKGCFWFAGRKKQIIVRDGANISPQEIEEVLYRHPAIRQAAVIGVPAPQASRGEKIVAFVSVRADQHIKAPTLHQFMKEALAEYKIPEEFIFQADLPVSPTGKIQRRALKEAYLAESSAIDPIEAAPISALARV